jgi:hypothetical protein
METRNEKENTEKENENILKKKDIYIYGNRNKKIKLKIDK